MKILKSLILSAASVCLLANVQAQEVTSGAEVKIGGEARLEYQSKTEKYDGNKLIGGSVPKANNEFDVEVNLTFDYETENTWGGIKLEFDNNTGVGSRKGDHVDLEDAFIGIRDQVDLEKAFFGINIMEEGSSRFDVEFGRNQGDKIFESKVQFDSYFDGIFLKYANSFENVGDFYAHVGSFMVNAVIDHYAFVGEIGLLDIADTGVYAKYSYIDWSKNGASTLTAKGIGTATANPYKYEISQLTAGWKLDPEVLRAETVVYGAYLWNHAAKGIAETNNKKKNRGWYLGAKVGEIVKAGDWSVEANYQHVPAQAVPGTATLNDASGIGRGDNQTTTFRGSNYKGYELDAKFALADNLNLQIDWQASSAADKTIGAKNTYKQLEVEAIFKF